MKLELNTIPIRPLKSKKRRKSEQTIKDEIKKWQIHGAVATLEELSARYNGKLRGWFAFFGRFRPSTLYGIFCLFEKTLVKWAKCKYKHLKRSWKKSAELMKGVADSTKDQFVHWKRGWYAKGGV